MFHFKHVKYYCSSLFDNQEFLDDMLVTNKSSTSLNYNIHMQLTDFFCLFSITSNYMQYTHTRYVQLKRTANGHKWCTLILNISNRTHAYSVVGVEFSSLLASEGNFISACWALLAAVAFGLVGPPLPELALLLSGILFSLLAWGFDSGLPSEVLSSFMFAP